MTSSGRVLALDIGSVRVGAAVSDFNRIIAQGLGVWNFETWREEFDASLKKYDPAIIVIGLPVRTDGTHGDACINVKAIMKKLSAEYPEREFELYDERFTTRIAQDVLISADISRRSRKKHVDKLAAVIILESWLESRRQY